MGDNMVPNERTGKELAPVLIVILPKPEAQSGGWMGP